MLKLLILKQQNEYSNLLHKTLADNVLNSPRQIYNCVEIFLPLDCTQGKSCFSQGLKNVYCQALGTPEYITVLCRYSVAGVSHLPMIIYIKSFPVDPYHFEGLMPEVSVGG